MIDLLVEKDVFKAKEAIPSRLNVSIPTTSFYFHDLLRAHGWHLMTIESKGAYFAYNGKAIIDAEVSNYVVVAGM